MKYSISIILLLYTFYTVHAQADIDSAKSKSATDYFLSLLNSSQKETANLSFDDPYRLAWSNLPSGEVTRKGISLFSLNDNQKIALHQILQTVLSTQGYQKILSIIQYDEATREKLISLDNPIYDRYGNQNYWFAVFGKPDDHTSWAIKFEGHHISLHFEFEGNKVYFPKMFLGINPALTRKGPYAGFHIMQDEHNLGNELFLSLDSIQIRKAILGPHPKNADVLTQTNEEPHLTSILGLKYSEMTGTQKLLTENIIRSWVDNVTPTLAKAKMKTILSNRDKILFTWRGTKSIADLHYYSVKGIDFIIEFTHRDGGYDHYHTLWSTY